MARLTTTIDGMRPLALTLDAHGVLLYPDAEAMCAALLPFGCQPDAFACMRANCEVNHLLDRGPEPDWPAIHLAYAAALGVAAEHHDEAAALAVEVYLSTRWVAAVGAVEAVARLAGAGYAIAIVSNTGHGQVEQLLERTGICALDGNLTRVAAIVDSKVVGVAKPDPAIFRLALESLDVRPEECLHVGDSLVDDVRGAQAAGLTAVHIDPLDLCREADHVHAASLSQLADALAT